MNWGKGIIVALVLFIGFIMYMVIQMAQKHSDLVEPDFYEKQLDIDNRVQATENAIVFDSEFTITQDQGKVFINFPSELEMSKATGTLHFYRPENAKLDQKFPLKVVNGKQVIDKSEIAVGNFKVKMDFDIGPKEYYIEKKIFVKK